MNKDLKILPENLIEKYREVFDKSLSNKFNSLVDSKLSIDSFSFYTSVSVVFSSKIEGEEIDLDSFIKHKRFGIEFLPDYTQKIDDLYDAYTFAKNTPISEENILHAHSLITKNILPKSKQGKIRTGNMFVLTDEGNIEYVAVSPLKLQRKINNFFHDLNKILRIDLSFEEVLYFASMIHLVFVKIHPFDDGNGRTARLLEKWFLAEKLGQKAWFINSEKHYYENHNTYYKNIRKLGLEYDDLNYDESLDFLLMLTRTLI
ncbi:MAG: Fic family protein [Flavobacteriia bacterium]|jgi:Fic family protein